MKKIKLLVLSLSVIFLCNFILQPQPWDVPAEFKTKKNPVAKTEKSLAEGKVKYNQTCAGCHGLTGKGDGVKLKKLAYIKPLSLTTGEFAKETDGEHFYKIKYGRGKNHSFSGKLDDESIWSVVHYMKTFATEK